MADVVAACPHCDRRYVVDGSFLGGVACCPGCRRDFTLASVDAAADQPPAEEGRRVFGLTRTSWGLVAACLLSMVLSGAWIISSAPSRGPLGTATAGEAPARGEAPTPEPPKEAAVPIAREPATKPKPVPDERPAPAPPPAPRPPLLAEAKPREDLPGVGLTAEQAYQQRVEAAYSAAKRGDADEANKLLAGCPADRRGWEWYYVRRLARFHLPPLTGHRGAVLAVEYSPDGHRLASGGADRTVRIWEGSASRVLGEHADEVVAVRFREDGGRVVSLGADRVVKEWDVGTGKVVGSAEIAVARVSCGAIASGGGWVAVGTQKGDILVWDTRQIGPAIRLTADDAAAATKRSHPVIRLAINRDGATFLSWAIDGVLIHHPGERTAAWLDRRGGVPVGVEIVRDPVTGLGRGKILDPDDPTAARLGHHWGGVPTALAISPDGLRAAGAIGKGVMLWDVPGRRVVAEPAGHTGPVEQVDALAFSRDSQRLASGGDHGYTLQVWDANTGRWTASLEGHDAAKGVRSIDFSPDGHSLSAACEDSSVFRWRATDGLVDRTIFGSGNTVGFSKESSRLHILGRSMPWRSSSVWDTRSFLPLAGWDKLLGHSDRFDRFAALRHNRIEILAIDGDAGWTPLSFAVAPLGGDPNWVFGPEPINEVVFVGDGRYLINIPKQRELPGPPAIPHVKRKRIFLDYSDLGIWDENRGGWSAGPVDFAGVIGDTRLLPATRQLITTRSDEQHRETLIVSPSSLTVVRSFPSSPGEAPSYRLHPDGDQIAIFGGGKLRLWNARTERFVSDAGCDADDVAFDPTGKRVATWAVPNDRRAARTVKVWELATGRLLYELPSWTVVFSPDGRRLASVEQVNVAIRDAATGRPLLNLPGARGLAFSPDGRSLAAFDLYTVDIRVADPPDPAPHAD